MLAVSNTGRRRARPATRIAAHRRPSTVWPVKVGVLQFFSWPERRVPLEQVYERALQRIVVMDRAGYDAVWLAEHHFTTYSVCPSVTLMALEAAHRTERLRIGTAVDAGRALPPVAPRRGAGAARRADRRSLELGGRAGFEASEFDAFGVPLDETAARFREGVEVVHAAWSSERLTFHGKFWDFDEVEVLPKPRQQPHPPTWVAATSPEAISWAAAGGYAILMDPHASFGEIAGKYDRYVAELAANGHPAPVDTPMARLVAVADTDAAAEQVARAGAAWTLGAYGHGTGDVSGRDDGERVERYVRECIVWGSPGHVRDELARLAEEMRLHHLMIAPLSHESFLRFTDEVLPHV